MQQNNATTRCGDDIYPSLGSFDIGLFSARLSAKNLPQVGASLGGYAKRVRD